MNNLVFNLKLGTGAQAQSKQFQTVKTLAQCLGKPGERYSYRYTDDGIRVKFNCQSDYDWFNHKVANNP